MSDDKAEPGGALPAPPPAPIGGPRSEAPASGAPPGTGWGAPPGSGWGAPPGSGWGAPPGSGWGAAPVSGAPPGSGWGGPPGSGWGPAFVTYPEANSAIKALALSIVGLLCCFVLPPIAWAMAHGELKAIDAGRRSPSPRSIAVVARVLGIIGTAIVLIGLILTVGAELIAPGGELR